MWVLRNETEISTTWFEPHDPSAQAHHRDDANNGEEAVMRAGGGGRCRRFVSIMARLLQFRLDGNKVDFKGIMAQWKIEVQHPESDLLAACALEGKEATAAFREIFNLRQQGRRGRQSSFGALDQRNVKQLKRDRDDRAALSGLLQQPVSEVDNASPWQLAVVLNQPSFTNSLQAYVGNDISEQLEAISRFCRQLSRQRKLSRDKEATAL